MKKRLLSILLPALAAAVAAGILLLTGQPAAWVTTASAAMTQRDTSLTLSFEVGTEGIRPETLPDFLFRLVSVNGGPLPAGGEGKHMDLKTNQTGEVSFPPIHFAEMGEYEYTLYQIPGNSADVELYDETVYQIRVAVLHDMETDSLYLSYSIRAEGQPEKLEKMQFINRFATQGYTLINQAGDTFD